MARLPQPGNRPFQKLTHRGSLYADNLADFAVAETSGSEAQALALLFR
jgi:hypothetical protein